MNDGLVQSPAVRRPRGEEVHANMSEPGGDRFATCVYLGGATHQCDQEQTHGGPDCLHSLTGGGKSDCPTYDNRRAEIVELAELKREILEAIWRTRSTNAEGCIGSRQKDGPYRPQIQAGDEVGAGQKQERRETEYSPRRSNAPGVESKDGSSEPYRPFA